jgi:uncharacterized protein (TIGR00255 family)
MSSETKHPSAINSMTGYGRGAFQLGRRSFCVELRSYNNRFLDVKIRLPWSGKELDTRVEAAVKASVRRGRVDITVSEETGPEATGRLQLDKGLATDLAAVLGQLAETLGCDLATAARLVPPMRELLHADPGRGMEAEAIWEAMEGGLRAGLDRLLEMRASEGRATLDDLRRHLGQLEGLYAEIRTRTGEEPRLHREKLMDRVETWRQEGISVEPERVAQEVALMADRCDVSEELARLESHVSQMEAIFGQDEPSGRKMEFLLQEFNRELNTIASKTLGAEVGHLVVEAKACVERMREQAQNVE